MIQQATRTLRTLLPMSGSVTNNEIEDAVNSILSLPQYMSIEKETLIREVQALYNIRIDDFQVIESKQRRMPWLNDRKASISWNFWNRYRDYLTVEKNFSGAVVSQIDRLTNRILDGLFDPTVSGIIDKKGLVVGQVQSGKTSNYTGLICKAADAGYKLIIVLAGIHNSLRSQTQLRLDEGFLGFNTQFARAFNQISEDIWIGVGRISKKEVAHSITSCRGNGDFSQGAFNSLGLNFNTNEPIIAVVKKNGRVLDRLMQWLSAQTVELNGRRVITSKSLLIIDDEADNASINTRPENDGTTRINGLIRDILRLFDKRSYVGYTATPFANIFIPVEQDELFPRDFIINLPAPSNYIGPDKIFGFQITEEDENSDTVLPIVLRINDYYNFVPDGHRSQDVLPDRLPPSLWLAIRSFILTCAVRRSRGQTKVHNSMLIHVSRYVVWQRHISAMVQDAFDFYRRGIEMNIPSVVEEIRQTFEVDTENYRSFKTISQIIKNSCLNSTDHEVQVHEWREVFSHLNEAAARIQVREINGGSADILNYFDHKNGLSVIAIGGDKLSRGLTLEGLSVSYYLRASRMYDTLMQMGRWFGYRPGYLDLCRLFTSRELNEWFCHIALAADELQKEFDYMADEAGSTPEQYALRVRTHPGILQISASNKIRRAITIDVSWAGRLVESYEFKKSPDIIHSNLTATINLIHGLGESVTRIRNSNYLWSDVSPELIRQWLLKFRLSDSLKAADPLSLVRFIDMQRPNNELTEWRVALMSKSNTSRRIVVEADKMSFDVGFFLRNCDETISGNGSDIYYLKKSHIISPNDEFIDLTDPEYTKAMERTSQLWQERRKEGEPRYPNGDIVRNEIRDPRNPLLLIYFLDPRGAGVEEESEPIVGYAISFPSSRFNMNVRYAVNEQLLPFFNQEDDLDNAGQDDEED